jgi:hypothetical protein
VPEVTHLLAAAAAVVAFTIHQAAQMAAVLGAQVAVAQILQVAAHHLLLKVVMVLMAHQAMHYTENLAAAAAVAIDTLAHKVALVVAVALPLEAAAVAVAVSVVVIVVAMVGEASVASTLFNEKVLK